MSKSTFNTFKRRIKGLMLKHMHGMITCLEFEAFITAYLDETLPPKQRRVFEWHLRLCRECRDYLAAYQRAIELSKMVGGPGENGIPEAVPEDLVAAVIDSLKQ